MSAGTAAEEIRRLQCGDCPSQVIGPVGSYANRYRVVHAKTCPSCTS
jgi:hypothetical protein